MPSCVWSTLGARAPQWEVGCHRRDARPQRCEKKQTVMCGGGKATHPTPFPLRECEPLMLTRVPIVSLFLELGLFAPGVLPVCLMMTVNVMASNRHLRWWSPPVSVVGEQTVGRVIVCPWSGERSSPCPASVMCAGVVSPCRPGRCRHRSESSSYCGRRRTSKTVVHQRLGLKSVGVTRPSSTLLLGVTWLWQSGTCPPLLQTASPPGACVKWRVEYDNEDGLRWWRGRERLSSGGLRHLPVSDWQMDDTSELLCVRWRLISECGRVSSVAGWPDWFGVMLGPPPANQTMNLE